MDLVSYIAPKPRASPSNIDGPTLLIHCCNSRNFKIAMGLKEDLNGIEATQDTTPKKNTATDY